MLLISYHNVTSRNRPLHLVAAKLDDGQGDRPEELTAKTWKVEIGETPRHASAQSVSRALRVSAQGFTIQDSDDVMRKRIKKGSEATGPGRPPLSFQLDRASTTIPAAPRAKTTTVAEQALTRTRTQRQKSTKHVAFSAVHIREHAVTVGVHDWCEGSLPIELDWKHTPTHSIPVDDFEWQRQRQGRTPRGRLPKLDYHQRKRLLRRVSGITEEDLLLLERQHIDSKYVTLHCSKTVTYFNKSQ